jgi:hypothetical protein
VAQQAQAPVGPPIVNRQSPIANAFRRVRFTEFQLLVVPSLMAVIGLLTIFLVPRRDTSFSWRDIGVSLGFVILLFLLTAWFSAIGFQGDQLLFPIVATLSGLGLIVVQRLHPVLEQKDLSAVSQRQVLYLAVGLIAMWATVVFFHHFHLFRRYKYLVGLTAIGLMVLTMVAGTTINGAKLWIVIGPVQVQPGEFVKLLLVFFMAAYLDDKRELLASDHRVGRLRIPPIPYLLPLGLMWALALLIVVVQNDFGSALLFFTIFLTMLYVASGRLIYVIAGLAAFAVGGLAIYRVAPHVGARVTNWLNPWRDGLDGGFQIIQGQYAVASGGVFGTGLGYGNLSLRLRGDRRRTRPARHAGHARALPPADLSRPLHRAAGGRWLRAPRRGRSDHHPRDAIADHHRRRAAPHPADRHHPPLHLLRRHGPDHQLHPRRAAALHLRPTARGVAIGDHG